MSSTAKKPRRKAAAKKKTQMEAVKNIVSEAVAAADVTNAQLVARRDAAVPRGVASAAPVYAKYAENAELWDVEG
ncbi:MAG: 4-aminobutyrate--2-oxoglutarate transaminase, partial [Sulfitobacter sp.]